MTLLITGGGGFVMSNLALCWMRRSPAARVVLLDNGPCDEALRRFLAPFEGRWRYVQASVLDPGALARIAADDPPEHIVHGATVCLSAPQSPDGRSLRHPESDIPATVLEVNIMGTVRLLEMARGLSGLKTFVNISSGAVYNDHGPEPPGPLPEEGWVDPPEFYGISKVASEQITRRYAQLFGLRVASCRLSGVYGPMDRWRPSRAYHCPPYLAVHRGLEGGTLRVNSLDSVGDHIHAQDVAAALIGLLDKDGPFAHSVYNIAQGEAVTLGTLLETVARILPGLRWEVAAPEACDHVQDPRHTGGRWGAYDIGRITRETSWRPRPLAEALRDYAGFVRSFGVTT